MIISLIGETEKKPIVLTLLNICQKMGDVLFVTNNRHYMRLFEQNEDEIEAIASGYFQNILIVVTDATPDEARRSIGFNYEDFEFIIFDNKLDASGDVTLYVQGCEMTRWESSVLEYLEDSTDYTTIHFGFGKNKIPYTSKMFEKSDIVEAKKMFMMIDTKITEVLVKILAPKLNLSPKQLFKVVSSSK